MPYLNPRKKKTFFNAVTQLSTGEFRSAQLSPSFITSAEKMVFVQVLTQTFSKSLFHHYAFFSYNFHLY